MNAITRREFLRRAGAVTVMSLGGATMLGCGGESDPCSDLSGLSTTDKAHRKTNGYRDETLIAAKRCDNCHFWKPAAAGQPCGTCTEIKGPIHAEGYCNLWAEPQAEGAEAAGDST